MKAQWQYMNPLQNLKLILQLVEGTKDRMPCCVTPPEHTFEYLMVRYANVKRGLLPHMQRALL